jgi:hypothetical protein
MTGHATCFCIIGTEENAPSQNKPEATLSIPERMISIFGCYNIGKEKDEIEVTVWRQELSYPENENKVTIVENIA